MSKAPNNASTLAAFGARNLKSTWPSGEHFNRAPDEVTWADVGTLGGYLERLREVSDAAFHEGEHAA